MSILNCLIGIASKNSFPKKRTGPLLISFIFLIFYGGFRIIGEQFREPDEHIGYLFNLFSMGTLLSLIMMVLGFFLLLKINKSKEV